MVKGVNATPTASYESKSSAQELQQNDKRSNATTGASAAGVRAIAARLVAFYFRAPAKAFFRTRVDYLAVARAVNPRFQAKEAWSWRMSSFGILGHAVRTYGWGFIPNHVLPPLLANAMVGTVLYTSYLQTLGSFHGPSSEAVKRVYPPPPIRSTLTAGFIAGSIQSVVAAPVDALQARFRTSDMLDGRYKNMWQYGWLKSKELGPRSIFAGYGLSLVKDSLGFGVFFATFEYVKAQSFYAFVTRYYGGLQLGANDDRFRHGPDGPGGIPAIRPHFAIEPSFLMLAGISASAAQQAVQYPVALAQQVYYSRLEALDRLLRKTHTDAGTLGKYNLAYKKTFELCSAQAMHVGGWRKWLYRGFLMNTLKQIPSTSAGLVIFELARRRYANEAEAVRIEKDGYDILLTSNTGKCRLPEFVAKHSGRELSWY